MQQREGMARKDWLADPYFARRTHGFPWLYGQPQEVWNEYAHAMGIDPSKRDPAETAAV